MNLKTSERPNKPTERVAVSYLEGYYMLEDIRLGLKIWDNQNDVDTQTADMRSIVYQTAADFEMRSIEHVRALISLIDKYENVLNQIAENSSDVKARKIAWDYLRKENDKM